MSYFFRKYSVGGMTKFNQLEIIVVVLNTNDDVRYSSRNKSRKGLRYFGFISVLFFRIDFLQLVVHHLLISNLQTG